MYLYFRFFFYFIGNFDEIPYEIKKPSGQDRTAAEGKFVAEATRRRRRILQSRILSFLNDISSDHQSNDPVQIMVRVRFQFRYLVYSFHESLILQLQEDHILSAIGEVL